MPMLRAAKLPRSREERIAKRLVLAGTTALAFLAMSCTDPREPPAPAGEGAERPASVRTVLAGTAEPQTLRLYTSPTDFPLPFSTYVPETMRVEALRDGRGNGIRFVSYLGGARHDSAFVYLYVYPPATPEAAAREVVRTAAERFRIFGDRTELEPVHRRPWAVVEYLIRSQGTIRPGVSGWVALGRQDDRWFHVIVQHPVEMEASFDPRAERILSGWRWSGGEGLRVDATQTLGREQPP